MTDQPYQALAVVKRITGKTIRLGVFEEACAMRMTEDKIVVVINRASVQETRYGFKVTRRGNTAYEFHLIEGTWVMVKPFTVWYDLSEPELHAAYHGRTPEEYEASMEWAEMCHRPGTPDFPLDNADRRKQGIK